MDDRELPQNSEQPTETTSPTLPGSTRLKTDEIYHLLVNAVTDYAIFALDLNGNIVTWNTGAQQLKGYTASEAIGTHFSRFYTPEDIARNHPAHELNIARATGKYEEEGWRVRKNGEKFWANVVISSLKDTHGTLRGYAKVTRDLTERLRVLEELRKSEQRFRLLVESVKDYAIIMLDPTGTVTSWNEGARRINGYEASEIIGQHFSKFYLAQDLAAGKPEMELRVAAQVGRFEDNGYRLRKDGSQFFANVVITAIRDSEGQLQGFSKVTRDITERREAEETLKQSEERFRLMIEGVKDYAIFMLDPNGNVATWNEGAKRNKLYEASEIIGQHFSKFYTDEDLKASKPQIELEVAKETGRYEDTGWRLRKDGTRFWANVVITAIYNDKGILLGFSKVTQDLTEKKLAEEALRRAYVGLEIRVAERTAELALEKQKAEQAVAARDEFLSIASHELKTPLTSLKLQVQLRRRNVEKGNLSIFSPERIKKMVTSDDQQIDRVVRLVDDMLDITRLSAGKLRLEPSEVDLCELVNEVLTRFSPQLDSAGITITIDSCTPVVGFWDRYRIEQVLINLLTNAMKYGAGKPVHIEVTKEKNQAVLHIRDQGIGIAEKDQARVFHQFERAVDSGGIGGMGLGLYIVRQIIENHGGIITLKSKLGVGSTFTVKLPLKTSSRSG